MPQGIANMDQKLGQRQHEVVTFWYPSFYHVIMLCCIRQNRQSFALKIYFPTFFKFSFLISYHFSYHCCKQKMQQSLSLVICIFNQKISTNFPNLNKFFERAQWCNNQKIIMLHGGKKSANKIAEIIQYYELIGIKLLLIKIEKYQSFLSFLILINLFIFFLLFCSFR